MRRSRIASRTRILAFIRAFWREYRCAPTLREIARGVNLGSDEAVRYHIRKLRAEGVVAWEGGAGRSIRLLSHTDAR